MNSAKTILKCVCGETATYKFEKRVFCLNCDKEVNII